MAQPRGGIECPSDLPLVIVSATGAAFEFPFTTFTSMIYFLRCSRYTVQRPRKWKEKAQCTGLGPLNSARASWEQVPVLRLAPRASGQLGPELILRAC